MVEHLVTLGFLILLQAVLGFDNLLYISLESRKAPEETRSRVRRFGIGLAVVLRLVLLFFLIKLITLVEEPFADLTVGTYLTASFNVHSVIVLVGGTFILYTAMKEIWHMLYYVDDQSAEAQTKSPNQVIAWIVLMNLVFSFDSILSALALTKEFWVMAVAIVTGGILMIVLADTVSSFLQRNRMYEVLGLFILFIVGIMLLSEGGHLAHMKFFGNPVTAMSKTTFYFVITILVLSDIVQSRYQRRLLAKHAKLTGEAK